MKFYAVKKGRTPGIYRSWKEAEEQVKGFSGAEFKSFSKITAAAAYLNWNAQTQKKVLQKGEADLQKAIKKIQTAARKQRKKPLAEGNDSYFAHVYTDGGTRNTGNYKGGHVKKTDKAAWAYQIRTKTHEYHGAGGERGASNNKMEQTALIQALQKLLALGDNQKKLLFVLDSKYVLNAINKNWLSSWQKRGWRRAGGELANKKEWQKISALLSSFPQATFVWTKGHAGNKGNEFVDHYLNRYMDEKE